MFDVSTGLFFIEIMKFSDYNFYFKHTVLYISLIKNLLLDAHLFHAHFSFKLNLTIKKLIL